MIIQLQPCGTEGAYLRHRRHGEDACDDCKAAHAKTNRANKRARHARGGLCGECGAIVPLRDGSGRYPRERLKVHNEVRIGPNGPRETDKRCPGSGRTPAEPEVLDVAS